MNICAATIIFNVCIPSHLSFRSHRSRCCSTMKDDCMFAPSYIAADLSQSLPTNVCTIKTISLFVYKKVTPQSPDLGRRGSTILVIGEILFLHAICASYHCSYSMCWLRPSRVWAGTYSAGLLLMSSVAQSGIFDMARANVIWKNIRRGINYQFYWLTLCSVIWPQLIYKAPL